jgi:hypothetical protein
LDKWVAQSKQSRGRGDKENMWNVQDVRMKQDEDQPQKCHESLSTCDAQRTVTSATLALGTYAMQSEFLQMPVPSTLTYEATPMILERPRIIEV